MLLPSTGTGIVHDMVFIWFCIHTDVVSFVMLYGAISIYLYVVSPDADQSKLIADCGISHFCALGAANVQAPMEPRYPNRAKMKTIT